MLEMLPTNTAIIHRRLPRELHASQSHAYPPFESAVHVATRWPRTSEVILCPTNNAIQFLDRTQSDRTVLVLDSVLWTVSLRLGQRKRRCWEFDGEVESKAEETKRIAASRFEVSDNRDAAIYDEPTSRYYEYKWILFREGQNKGLSVHGPDWLPGYDTADKNEPEALADFCTSNELG